MVAAFKELLQGINPDYGTFDTIRTLQVNLGNLCNLSCRHCHMEASPAGQQVMGRELVDRIVALLARKPGVILDITGGCPEMNPHFRHLVETTDRLAPRRILRSNLTIMTEPGMEWLPEFCADHDLVVTASLPCYLEENVDAQRGERTYGRSITALKRLNSVGYGCGHELNLVYNPGGSFIPGSQGELEKAYRDELAARHGIVFDHLFTITNAPIGRFREYLEAKGAYDRYLNLLATSFNPDAAGSIMCRTLVSVDWQGVLYNCDFNQAIGLPITGNDGSILMIDDLEEATRNGTPLRLAQHCYCCTAGEGSSCTGALV